MDADVQLKYKTRIKQALVLIFYRTQVNLGSDSWVRLSVTEPPFADLTDVTLADEDTNAILADDANGHSKAMWQCK